MIRRLSATKSQNRARQKTPVVDALSNSASRLFWAHDAT
jgi:hypothetical protein